MLLKVDNRENEFNIKARMKVVFVQPVNNLQSVLIYGLLRAFFVFHKPF